MADSGTARLDDLARAVRAAPAERISAVWTRAPEGMQSTALQGRTVIALGCGLPEGIDGAGLSLDKAPPVMADAVAPPSLSEAWRHDSERAPAGVLAAAAGTSLDAVLQRVAFVFKDASPDTLLTALLVLARLAGVPVREWPAQWIAEVTAWDQGRMPQRPEQSWSALASTWVHAEFPTPKAADEAVARRFAEVWHDALRFLAACIADGLDPAHLPPHLPGDGARARAALARLQQIYEATVQSATVLQLAVPLRGGLGRTVAVDALCYEELEASDAVKLFGRGDRERSPSGRGFALAVSHRPRDKDWNRFTIHCDPDSHLDLTPLWEALERAETDAWPVSTSGAITRPADAQASTDPRFRAEGLPRSFERADLDRLGVLQGEARPLVGVLNCWVNPWFLFPDRSLIGSPGKDKQRVDAGPTLLSWQQVIDTVWRCYSPLSAVQVLDDPLGPADGPSRPLWQVAPLTVTEPDKQEDDLWLRFVRWAAASESFAHAPARSATLMQALATLAERSGIGTLPTQASLKPPGTFAELALNGGFAVVTDRGCLVVDDWRKPALDAAALTDAMQRARRVCLTARTRATEFQQLSAVVRDLLHGDKEAGRRSPSTVLRQLADARFALATTTAQRDADMLALRDGNASLLYQQLNDRWLQGDRLQRIDSGLERLQQTVRGVLDARLTMIANLGFPATVAASLAGPLTSLGYWALQQAGLPLPGDGADNYRTMVQVLTWPIVTWLFYIAVVQLQHASDAKQPPSR